MKKSMVFILVLSVIALIGLQQVNADSGPDVVDRGCGCGRGVNRTIGMDAETRSRYNTFLNETRELRRQIAAKRFEQRSMMFAKDSDVNAVAKLTEEIGHLQDTLRAKAREMGLEIGAPGVACAGAGGFGGVGRRGWGGGMRGWPSQMN